MPQNYGKNAKLAIMGKMAWLGKETDMQELQYRLRTFAEWLYGLWIDVRDFWCGGPPDEDGARGFEVQMKKPPEGGGSGL